jgi:hypothetical protein
MNIEQRTALEGLIDKEIQELRDESPYSGKLMALVTEKVKWWEQVKDALYPERTSSWYDR